MMHQPICECEQALCPGEGWRWYVTVQDCGRHGYLLWPYGTHSEALANVQRWNDLACCADGRAHWYAYGTARVLDAEYWPRTVFGK